MNKIAFKGACIHILNAIGLIESFVDEISETVFLKHVKLQSGVQYQFLIIVEAVKYIDHTVLERYSYA